MATMEPTPNSGRAPRAATPLGADPDKIAALFSAVFNDRPVAPDDDFFAIGGDSLIGATLMTLVERQCGVLLSISTLLEAPTPRALSAVLVKRLGGATSSGRCLIAVRPEGIGPPLVCLHGMNGHITYGESLKTVFGLERPVFAIRARGLVAGERPLRSVEDCAEAYIREIRRVRPNGPYLLLAPCGPSIVAYEMAQQLTRDGERVSGLVMADPAASGRGAWMTRSGLALALVRERSTRAAPPANRNDAQNATDDAERMRLVERTLGSAIDAYMPAPYGGETLILYSKEWGTEMLDPKGGFPALLPRLRAVAVSDTHLHLQNDFRGRPATEIRSFLADVAPL